MSENTTVQTETGAEWSKVTPLLRWRNGVLEQLFSVTVYEIGKDERACTEWRPVPVVADDPISRPKPISPEVVDERKTTT